MKRKTSFSSIINTSSRYSNLTSNLALASPLPVGVKVSFEFFPPDTDKSNQTLWNSILRLAPLNPSFVSITYGAGGTTRERTHDTVSRIHKETKLKAAAHLTCVSQHVRKLIQLLANIGLQEFIILLLCAVTRLKEYMTMYLILKDIYLRKI